MRPQICRQSLIARVAAAGLWLLPLVLLGVLALPDTPRTHSQALAGPDVARVVQSLAPVFAGPGPEHSLLWRLHEGSQVVVRGEIHGPDAAVWRQVRLWNTHDGWMESAALSFEPFPPPPPPPERPAGEGGPCRPRPERRPHGPQAITATATAVKPTSVREVPGAGPALTELAAGTPVEAVAWVFGPDERVQYRVRSDRLVGWAEPGAIALRTADPVTRQVDGRSIVEPLQGKGLWFVLDSREQGWDGAQRVAAAARVNGISHLYVEVATSRGGFWGARWLDELLPAARAVGVRLIGSVYPCLDDLPTDLALAREVAQYRTPDGLMLDGLTADIEETLASENIQAYGELLRHYVGDDYLLVATVYPPEGWFAPRYPWPALAASWNAVVPMAYWRHMEERPFTPAEVYAYTQRNITQLRALVGRQDLPVQMLGQLFELGRPLLLGPDAPTAAEIEAAAVAARDVGAVGISYFDRTRATPAHWEALAALRW